MAFDLRSICLAVLLALIAFACVSRVSAEDELLTSCECPCPCDDGGSSGFSVTWYGGTNAWWMAVTIPGSTSVQIDCGNGQGYMRMSPGWAANMWTFSPSNGQPCKSNVSFIVNGGAAQSAKAPY